MRQGDDFPTQNKLTVNQISELNALNVEYVENFLSISQVRSQNHSTTLCSLMVKTGNVCIVLMQKILFFEKQKTSFNSYLYEQSSGVTDFQMIRIRIDEC